MVTVLNETDVVALQVGGTLTRDDYEQVIVPALDEAASGTGSLRVLFELEDDEIPSWTAGAMLDDAKLGLNHWRDFHRMAVTTDNQTVHRVAPILSALVPGEVKAFGREEHDAALAWLRA